MPKPILVLTTTDSLEKAKDIAQTLSESKLAACVSIVKNEYSFYRWEGKLCAEQEYELKIKTDESKLAAIEICVKQLSGYDCPEFITTPIESMASAYSTWFYEQLK